MLPLEKKEIDDLMEGVRHLQRDVAELRRMVDEFYKHVNKCTEKIATLSANFARLMVVFILTKLWLMKIIFSLGE